MDGSKEVVAGHHCAYVSEVRFAKERAISTQSRQKYWQYCIMSELI